MHFVYLILYHYPNQNLLFLLLLKKIQISINIQLYYIVLIIVVIIVSKTRQKEMDIFTGSASSWWGPITGQDRSINYRPPLGPILITDLRVFSMFFRIILFKIISLTFHHDFPGSQRTFKLRVALKITDVFMYIYIYIHILIYWYTYSYLTHTHIYIYLILHSEWGSCSRKWVLCPFTFSLYKDLIFQFLCLLDINLISFGYWDYIYIYFHI